jgi:hypothetical protein
VCQASQVPEQRQKVGLVAGGSIPLRILTERGARELIERSRLAESGCLADEPDQGILVGHKVSLQVTWQEAKPCTGIRLRPNRSRMLLRLSAQLRRP